MNGVKDSRAPQNFSTRRSVGIRGEARPLRRIPRFTARPPRGTRRGSSAVISLNLGYIFPRALLAPDANWNDEAEIAATVDLMLRGAGVTETGK
jgi:hypothetical protein